MATKNGIKTIQDEQAEQMWDELTGDLRKIIRVFGGLLFIPVMLLLGLGYGLRAGIIAGTEKTLSLFKSWWEE